MTPKPIPLRRDMTLLPLSAARYRTNRLTALLAVPLRESTAAGIAILPDLLSRRTRRYPTEAALCEKLDMLYGASLACGTFRAGAWQVLQVSIEYLQARLTPDRTDLTDECVELLLDTLTAPLLDEDGAFYPEDFAREQRCLQERLRSRLNDKRLYARRRAMALLCPGEPYAVDPLGTPETVAALTPAAAAEAYRRLLCGARIRLLYQGDANVDALIRRIEHRFAALPERRGAQPMPGPVFTLKQSEETEHMDIDQAKLVLGFRIAATEPDGPVYAARLMNALLGGGPTSLLFTHVREERGLCYYCHSAYSALSGTLLIDSGIDPAAADTAKAEILRQLEAIRQGQFSDGELEAARRALIQQFATADGSTAAREEHYGTQLLFDRCITPEQYGAALREITRDEVCRVARSVHFDTTYLLCPKERPQGGEVTG